MGNEGDTVSEPTIITKQVIEQVFDDSAISYDRVGPSIFTQFGNRLVERMPLFSGARVLDVAMGKVAVLLPVARRVGPLGDRQFAT
jgi:O-methyltransferase/aklanonic acid methyltransferase